MTKMEGVFMMTQTIHLPRVVQVEEGKSACRTAFSFHYRFHRVDTKRVDALSYRSFSESQLRVLQQRCYNFVEGYFLLQQHKQCIVLCR